MAIPRGKQSVVVCNLDGIKLYQGEGEVVIGPEQATVTICRVDSGVKTRICNAWKTQLSIAGGPLLRITPPFPTKSGTITFIVKPEDQA